MRDDEKPTIEDKVAEMTRLAGGDYSADGIYRWADGQLEYLGASLLEVTVKDDDAMAAAWDDFFRARSERALAEVAARRDHVWITGVTGYVCAHCRAIEPMEPGYPRDGQCPGTFTTTQIDIGAEAAELSVDLARLAAQPDDESETRP